MLLPNMMVVYRVSSNADCSSNPTTRALLLHQMACFCASVAVFQLLRPSALTLYEMSIFMSRTHLTESTSLKISMENPAWNVPTNIIPKCKHKREQSLLWHLRHLVAFATCWSHYEYCRCTGFLGLPELPGRCSKCNWQWWCSWVQLCSIIRRNGYIHWCESCLPCLFNEEHPCKWRTCMYSL